MRAPTAYAGLNRAIRARQHEEPLASRTVMVAPPQEPDLTSIAALLERIETYEELEALLWFSSGSEEPRSAREAAEALSLPERSVTDALNRLAAAGLLRHVTGSSRFRFETKTPELEMAVRDLALLHQQNRVEVVRLMNAHAIARLRHAVLATFGPHLRRRSEK